MNEINDRQYSLTSFKRKLDSADFS